ncbi:MAG: alpha-amylase family protein [Candidatus Coatesbacteria bacterium]
MGATMASPLARPRRWVQLTLVEGDLRPGARPRYSARWWLDFARRVRAEGACLSAGGCVAFYPTRIPLHYRSRWMGRRDPFGELVRGCRRLGMVVVARTDPHAVHDPVFRAHPDWIARDEHGRPRRHWASPEMWVTCGLGPYHFEFMTRIHAELMARYPLDGIFVNRWDGSGMCWCRHCRDGFRRATGLALPSAARLADPLAPVTRAFRRWRADRLFALWDRWDGVVRAANPAARCIPNTGGGAVAELDMVECARRAEVMVADRQARSGATPAWMIGQSAKAYRAVLDRKPAIGLFNVGLEEAWRWKDSVQTAAELRIWSSEMIANGMVPWVCKFGGALQDERWVGPVTGILRRHRRLDGWIAGAEPVARVGVVFSQPSAAAAAGREAGRAIEAPSFGVSEALIEARIPFELVHSGRLGPARLARFRALVLPNITCLTEAQCAALEAYAAGGGGIVATLETSRRDGEGRLRPDFGLARLFGASAAGPVEGPMRNSYLKLHPPHPVLRGLADAGRILNGLHRVPLRAVAPGRAPLTYVPSYPDLPMEMVYPRHREPGPPALVLRRHGKGRVAFVPFDLDRTFWEIRCADHGVLLRNLVTWAAGRAPSPVRVDGPGLLDVTVWRSPRAIVVFLVNLNNPMAMRGPYREILPAGPYRVRLDPPPGVRVHAARLPVTGRRLPLTISRGAVAVTVASVQDYEAVVFETI